MKCYIVRIIEDHQIVGIFYAGDIGGLAWLVDQCTNPLDCEYGKLPRGGIMWPDRSAVVPLAVSDDEDPPPFTGGVIDEYWAEAFYDFDGGPAKPLKWKQFKMGDLYENVRTD